LWADGAYLEVERPAPPIDLFAIARNQGIKQIKLRLMVQDRALIPVPGGFDVYIRDFNERDLDLESCEPADALSTRQRFTLAHEIAHTRFYKFRGQMPVPKVKVKTYDDPDGVGLEEICNRAAGRLIVPRQLLAREIGSSLGGHRERIDVAFVRMLAARFRASFDVVLRRLRGAEPENNFARCIVLVREKGGEPQIRAWYLGTGLLSALRPIDEFEFKPLRDWLPELPLAIFRPGEVGALEFAVKGRALRALKFPLGHSASFLLQLDDASQTPP
jgi:hypothetical protein